MADGIERYESDWTGAYRGRTDAVVLPSSIEEIATVLSYCDRHSIAVVTQGGNTGLVGGGVPADGELVIGTERLTAITVTDEGVVAGAGATLARVQDQLAVDDREVPVDLGSKDSATIGGMVAADAGGVRAFRHGRMGHLVSDVTAVTATGEVITGDEAVWISAGLEGTACVVAGATLRTIATRPHTASAVVGSDDPGALIRLASGLAASLPALEAAEYVQRHTLELTPGRPVPPHEHLLLLAARGTGEVENALIDALASVDEGDAMIVTGGDVWDRRHQITAALHRTGPPLKLDVRVPPDEVPGFLDDVATRSEATCHVFGHLMEGSLHVNLLEARGPDPAREILSAAVSRGGRCVGEHGAGRAKRRFLELETDPAPVERFGALKARYDPNNILNPAVVVPLYYSSWPAASS